jgi:nitrogen fixation NifU-like protein
MSDDLYHMRLVALARARDGAGRLDPPALAGEADNPLCGDRVRVTVRLTGDRIDALGHETRGCLLCEASAAAIGRRTTGGDVSSFRAVTDALRGWLKGEDPAPPRAWPELADFAPVRPVRSRHDCVMLPFEAVLDALAERSGSDTG